MVLGMRVGRREFPPGASQAAGEPDLEGIGIPDLVEVLTPMANGDPSGEVRAVAQAVTTGPAATEPRLARAPPALPCRRCFAGILLVDEPGRRSGAVARS